MILHRYEEFRNRCILTQQNKLPLPNQLDYLVDGVVILLGLGRNITVLVGKPLGKHPLGRLVR
jgi:hypothetical protein